jgi:hypothetical protein
MVFVSLVGAFSGIAAEEIGNKSRFVASSDGTVLDRETGLMWAATDNGEDINWADAVSYCDAFQGGGHTDWRLPTEKELKTIFDPNSEKKFKTNQFITLTACCPWSGDSRGKKRAVGIIFIIGEKNVYSKTESKDFRALPVRKAR